MWHRSLLLIRSLTSAFLSSVGILFFGFKRNDLLLQLKNGFKLITVRLVGTISHDKGDYYVIKFKDSFKM